VYGTAFALFNPFASATVLTPRYIDATGLIATAGNITIEPKAHQTAYFDQIFPNAGTVQGTLALSTTGADGVSAMVLRSNATPYNMTSFSAVSGTAGYTIPGAVSPRAIYSDITAEAIVNAYLPYVPLLRVTVTTAGTGYATPSTYTPLQVRAISETTGRVIRRKADPTSGTNYDLYMPPGLYTLKVMGWLAGQAFQYNGVWLDYTTDPVNFTLNNTTAFVNVPIPTQRIVTGRISNWSELKNSLINTVGLTGTANTVNLAFYGTSLTDPKMEFVVYCITNASDGTYNDGGSFSTVFPDGNYTSAILYTGKAFTAFDSSTYTGTVPTENITLQHFTFGTSSAGTFTIDSSNNAVSLNGPSSIVKLAGTGTAVTGPFNIIATDNAVPDFGYSSTYYDGFPTSSSYVGGFPTYPYPGYIYYPKNTTWTQNTFGGLYSAYVGDESTYKVSNTYIVYTTAMTTAGIVTYAPASGAAVEVNGDTSYNFNITNLPTSLVKVSGKVIASNVTNQATAIVIARSNEIIGEDGNLIPGLSYYTNTAIIAPTDGTLYGTFTIYVYPGKNYQIYIGNANNTTMIQ